MGGITYTTEQYINKAKKIHGDKYYYSKVDYISSTTKIIVVCQKHGEFLISPNVHLQGVGCAKCSFDRKSFDSNVYIEKCKIFHGDKYDYSKTEYINWSTYVTVTCKKHGDFNIRASDHYYRGCQKCGYENLLRKKQIKIEKKTYNQNDFLLDSKKVHGDKYDYSLVEYKNKTTKVKIICELHGEFKQSPRDSINGSGCPKCRNKKSQEQFIKECEEKHNNRYDYSLVKYINTSNKIKIICKQHGVFEQIADHHVRGSGCPNCQGVRDTKNFILKSEEIHLDRYDYSNTEYKGKNNRVIIKCKIHGEFRQLPTHHMQGSGCPECNNSKGENIIIKLLKNNNVKYKRQKTFDDCQNKKKLQFDFYIQKYNLCIEFDGIQHYKPIEWFGGVEAFESLKIRDQIKTKYCLDNNIELIRIRYDENILDKLYFLSDI